MSQLETVRIITWNCRSGSLERNIEPLERLKPDIIVFQEIGRPFENSKTVCGIFDERVNKGVAIITFNGYSVDPYPVNPDVPDYFVPAKIHGPVSFPVLAVWTQKQPKYVRSIIPALKAYHTFLSSSPPVVLGDFNSDVNLNQKSFPKRYHMEMVDYCHKTLGLISSYHAYMHEEHGQESEKTFYLYGHKDRPFHFDYCFIPESWQIKSVKVGDYEEWHPLSDHSPVIVDVII